MNIQYKKANKPLADLVTEFGQDLVDQAIGQLDHRQRRVVNLTREGLNGEEIGKREGDISRNRVRQIYHKAISKIRLNCLLAIKKTTNDSKEVFSWIIADTSLSERVRGVCAAYGIVTVLELVVLLPSDLLYYRNLGQHSVKEIEDWLDQFDLRLGYRPPKDSPDFPVSAMEISSNASAFLGRLDGVKKVTDITPEIFSGFLAPSLVPHWIRKAIKEISVALVNDFGRSEFEPFL